jgi:hypothetical protein
MAERDSDVVTVVATAPAGAVLKTAFLAVERMTAVDSNIVHTVGDSPGVRVERKNLEQLWVRLRWVDLRMPALSPGVDALEPVASAVDADREEDGHGSKRERLAGLAEAGALVVAVERTCAATLFAMVLRTALVFRRRSRSVHWFIPCWSVA